MNQQFWKNKKVLVTGHTGFKGSWLAIWLSHMGAKVVGYALEPYSNRDNFVISNVGDKIIDIRGDIRDYGHLLEVFTEHKPEIVFHLAAQPLVRLSYEKPIETYDINVMGTIKVLEAIRNTDSVKTGIMITTDKCYENKEQLHGYVETDPFGGYDPYSSSKGCDEILISSYRRSFFLQENGSYNKAIASVRAGNVIGGGDWAKDRIVPDCIRSLENNEDICLRNPYATRPFEHVLEPLSGYILLAEKMWEDPILFASGWNFGPEEDSVCRVIDVAQGIIKNYGYGNIIYDSNQKHPHEATLLSLNIDKAKSKLGWKPVLSWMETIAFTTEWYKKSIDCDMYEICVDQIERFMKKTI